MIDFARRGTRTLFEGHLVTVTDITCGRDDLRCVLGERADRLRVVFTRTGAVRSHAMRYDASLLLGDPTHALVLDAAHGRALCHRSKEVHTCTVLAFQGETVATALPGRESAVMSGGHHRDGSPLLVPGVLMRYHRLRNALLHPQDGGAMPAAEIEAEAIALLRQLTSDRSISSTLVRQRPALRSAAEQRRRELAETAKAVIAADPTRPHRLDALAHSLGVSPSHLAHVFRDEVGMPLHRYHVQLRMALALNELGASGRNLSRLALDLGFANHSHFTSAFRQWFGFPPSRAHVRLRRLCVPTSL